MMNWREIPDKENFKNLLIGNGFSINVSEKFRYDILLDEARKLAETGEVDIYPETFRLFTALDTTNFEEVLKVYHHAFLVHEYNKPAIDTAYKKLQNGLFSTIRKKHVLRIDTPTRLIYENLKTYRKVFTTNYDLIPYWSFFDNRLGDMKDFFWGDGERVTFNKNDTEVFHGNETLIYYLHGALHLEVTEYGRVQKRRIADTLDDEVEKLKETFIARDGRYPLFITEGKSEQKIRKIGSNDYLSFCYAQLNKIRGKLVIYGHSLSEEYDNHIVQAILNNQNISDIAISIYSRRDQVEIDETEAILRRQLRGKNLYFFDSLSHPLNVNV